MDHPSDWRILIMDGHGSHDSDEFRHLCTKNKVQPFYLPSNTSHELHPLDVGCFSPLKMKYCQIIEDLGILDITASGSKRRFIRAYVKASEDAFKPDTIRSGFRHSGIWPFHPEHVPDRLRPDPPPSTPPQRPQSPDIPLYFSPQNALQMKNQVAEVYGELEGITRKHQIYTRGWAKALDTMAARVATETVKSTRNEVQAEANKQTRCHRVRPRDG